MIATLGSVRVARGLSRAEFLLVLRDATGHQVKRRTLRAWESGQNTVPAWVVDAYRVTLDLTDAEVVAVVKGLGANHDASRARAPERMA